MKRVSLLMVLLAFALLLSPQASATIYNMSDKNSTLGVDAGSQAGAYNWVVDNTPSVLYQQWFWYRIGNTAEASVDSLPLIGVSNPVSDYLKLTYGSDTGLEISVQYILTGGNPNTHTSDVGETITIDNNTTSAMDFHFFQYSDFDLASNVIDRVVINPNLQKVLQIPVGSGPMLSETVITPAPNRAEANYYANTLGELNDGNPTTLNNVLNAGPGDVTWAFEWDKTITAGGSFIISKDKNLAPVPEPAPLAFLGGILVFLARKFRTYVV